MYDSSDCVMSTELQNCLIRNPSFFRSKLPILHCTDQEQHLLILLLSYFILLSTKQRWRRPAASDEDVAAGANVYPVKRQVEVDGGRPSEPGG